MTALEALQRSLPLVGGALIVLYIIGGAIHRLYFSPIAKFPGPKFAALTLWYEFYYDVIKRGRYAFEIAEMHKKYGKSCIVWLCYTLTHRPPMQDPS